MEQTKQPKGMYVLGFAEVFERLSYYTLSYLLILYASDSVQKGGLGWSKQAALALVGYYTLAAYALPLISAFLADKFIGTYRASIFGAALIITGHLCMLLVTHHDLHFFYLALCLVATGTSFFKPSMPTLLGRLYKPRDIRRESGFKFYYMGINTGAMIAGFSSGILLQNFGYRIALASAAIGMSIGFVIMIVGKKHLITNDKVQKAEDAKQALTAISKSSPVYKKAFGYLMFSFLFYTIWGVTYNLAVSGTLTVYVENYTSKIILGYDVPTTFFLSLENIGIILFAPLLAYIFQKCALKNKPIHFFTQMVWSSFIILLAIGYFAYLSHIVQNSMSHGGRPFGWIGICIFIMGVSVSEVLMSPVMMSAISLLSPSKYKTFFQACYLTVLGITGILANKIGSISLDKPFQTFSILTVVSFVGFVLFAIFRKRMVLVALQAETELHLNVEKKNNT